MILFSLYWDKAQKSNLCQCGGDRKSNGWIFKFTAEVNNLEVCG